MSINSNSPSSLSQGPAVSTSEKKADEPQKSRAPFDDKSQDSEQYSPEDFIDIDDEDISGASH